MEERLNRRNWAELSPCRKSAGFTINTNAEPHKLSTSGDLAPAGEFSWHGAARSGDVKPTELRDLGLGIPWLIVGSSASHNGSV
jgi:hypothetical protein